MKKIRIFVAELAAPLTLVIVTALLYTGCFSERKAPLAIEQLAVFDDAGISRAIRVHFDTTLGQIIAIEPYTAQTASAVVSVTRPKPDVAKVWLVKENGVWAISKVVRQYSTAVDFDE